MGIGRKGSQWDSYPNSLALSFTMKPNTVPTLTPIEIGILVVEFIKIHFGISVFLKWPNDLMTNNGKKCGGIIAQYIDQEKVIAGLGLNLGNFSTANTPLHYKHGLGSVSSDVIISSEDQKNLSAKIYEYILNHRISDTPQLQKHFYESCIHIGKLVSVDDDGEDYVGLFVGIGKNGEALVEIDSITKSFITSSLKILN